MQKLRGTGNTFSTSGKYWRPFRFNPQIARKRAQANRIKKAEHALPGDKAGQRQAAEQAYREWLLKPNG